MPQYDINLREYSRILRKRKFVVILTTIALGVFSTAFAIFKAPTPLYTSVCSIKFERETTVEGLYAKTISWSMGDDIETQVSIINSYSILEKVAERLRLIPKADVPQDSPMKANVIRVIEDLQSKVEVTRENLTNILNIKVKDVDPAFAQRLANTIALTYRDQHSENQLKRMTDAIRYIDEQLINVRQKLKESEEAFNKFSQDNQLLSIDLQGENLLAGMQEIQNELRKLVETKRELQVVVGRLEKFIQDPALTGQSFYFSKALSQYQVTHDALVGLLLKKDTLLEDYTKQHPEVVEVNRRIVENARKMKLLLELQARELEKREADAREEYAELERKSAVLMEKKLEYDRLKRRVELYHDMTTLLERKHQEGLIKKAEKPEEVTIVKPALLSTMPVNPPRTATTGMLGLLIGLVLGMVFAFVVETFDTSLGAIEDVEQTLNTQVLGVLPHAIAKDIQESLKERFPEGGRAATSNQNINLIAHFSPTTMIVESFRALRTNIQFKDAEKRLRTLSVTSTSPQEGKTFVSTNLAITMAQGGVKTLLVGSDMRKPMLDRVFGVDMTPGLSDILLGNYPWRETVKTVTDLIIGKLTLDEVMMTPGLDNLCIITSGTIPPNPAELIDSKRLKDFLEEAKKEYDLVIFDSPPILSTADAAILATKVDGVLLVYRVGSVSRGLLKRAMTQLQQVKCNILGVILNGMKPDISPDFQDFKYYKYYYSYGTGRETKAAGGRRWGFWPLKKESAGTARAGEISGQGPKEISSKETRGKKRFSLLGTSLIVVALALLGGGVLWQNGIIDPVKLLDYRKWANGEILDPVFKKIFPPPPATGIVPKRQPVPRTESGPKPVERPAVAAKVESGSKPEEIPAVAAKTESRAKPVEIPAVAAKTESRPKPAEIPAVAAKTESRPKPAETPAVANPFSQPKTPFVGRKETVAEKKVAAAEQATSPAAPIFYPYSLYLGSYRTMALAKRAVDFYRGKGLDPYWAGVVFEQKGLWYRVFAGYFREIHEVESFAREHGLKKPEYKRTEYTNLIGVYSRAAEAGPQMQRLVSLNYSPYTMKDHEGKTRLLVGAFVTEEGAQRQSEDLKSDGIESRVVKR